MPKPYLPRQASLQGLRSHEAVLVWRLQKGEHRGDPKPIVDDAKEKDGGFPIVDDTKFAKVNTFSSSFYLVKSTSSVLFLGLK